MQLHDFHIPLRSDSPNGLLAWKDVQSYMLQLCDALEYAHSQKVASLRGSRYRYSRYADGSEELYDHESDPMEWKNLTTDPKMEAVMARFRPLLPKYDEPEIPKHAIDKKRMRRVMKRINGMSKEFKEQSEANKLDPVFVKNIYAETR